MNDAINGKFTYLTLHDGGVVAELAAKVLVVAGAHGNKGAVGNLLEREYLKIIEDSLINRQFPSVFVRISV